MAHILGLFECSIHFVRLAASIAAEEGGPSMYNASTSTAHTFSEDYKNDSDEEMIVVMTNKLLEITFAEFIFNVFFF